MKSIEQEKKILQETIVLVKLFLKYNLSDEKLAKITNISSSTIQRRLTNEQTIKQAFNSYKIENFENDKNIPYGQYIYEIVQKQRQQNLYEAKKRGGVKSQENNMYLKAEDGEFKGNKPIINLLYIYNNPKKSLEEQERVQFSFLVHMMLHFRLRYQSISELTNIDMDTLIKKLTKYNPSFYISLNLMDNAFFLDNQKQAQTNIMNFYNEFKRAKIDGNKDKLTQLIHQIDDSSYQNFKKNYQEKIKKLDSHNTRSMSLTQEEVLIVLKHQLKYSISTADIANDLEINRNTLSRRYHNLFELKDENGNYIYEYEILKRQYEHLADYHQDKSKEYWYKKR